MKLNLKYSLLFGVLIFFGLQFVSIAHGITFKEIFEAQKGKVLDAYTENQGFNLFLNPTPTPTPASSENSVPNLLSNTEKTTRIVVRAKSSYASGYGHMQLKLGNELLQEWDLTGSYNDYVFDTQKKLDLANLRVYFTNDYYKPNIEDRNIFIEYLLVDAKKYPTSDLGVYSTGTWQAGSGCLAGYKQSIELDCNGYFEYPTAVNYSPATSPQATTIPTAPVVVSPVVTPNTISNNSEVIDTLAYFISKKPEQSLNGTHALSQTVNGNNIVYVKWANDSYENYSYDKDYIYIKEDHSGSPVPGSYTYSDGRWLKRNMKIGEVVNASENKINYFSGNTCDFVNSSNFPYKVTLESHLTDYNLGGNIGKQDVIVIRYDYQSSNGDYEKSYYSKDWGWVKWELYRNGQLLQISVFNNSVNQSPITPNLNISCLSSPAVPKESIKVLSIPKSNPELVSHLYACVLNNKSPDQTGVNYWLANLQGGLLSVEQTYTYFYGYQSNVSNEDFVTSLYNCIMFREPDKEGYEYWLGILKSGQDTKANQVQYFLKSAGFTGEILTKLKNLK